MADKITILNTSILRITQADLLSHLNMGVLITPNLDHLIKLQKDKEFYDAYQKAEWVVCDSRILYFLSKLLKRPFPEAIPGSSFFTAFYEYHKDDPNCRIFLLGAREGIAKKAMERINERVGCQLLWGGILLHLVLKKMRKSVKHLLISLTTVVLMLFLWESERQNKRNGL